MIVARAPLRMSFVGGGTDLPEFYRNQPGRVISAAIDKHVYIAVNRTAFIDKISVRYSQTETVSSPAELHHTRVRAALEELRIGGNIEIASFASLPSRTGLGSSSTFTVALLAALNAYCGRPVERPSLAENACRLEIDRVGEPIGKQDQYAAAFGGLHVYQFNPDGSVEVCPVHLTTPVRRRIEYHMLVFFTGITRDAGGVLRDQAARTADRMETLSRMAAAVPTFQQLALAGDVRGMGELLHETWQWKRSLSGLISNGLIDTIYQAGMEAGAWGGKLLGAGGGGCVLFFAHPDHHDAIRATVTRIGTEQGLTEFRELPVSICAPGCEIVFHGTADQ